MDLCRHLRASGNIRILTGQILLNADHYFALEDVVAINALPMVTILDENLIKYENVVED